MLAGLFKTASEFFILGIIPAIIIFIIELICNIKKRRYKFVKAFFMALLEGVLTFISVCIGILTIVFYLGAFAVIVIIILLILALLN